MKRMQFWVRQSVMTLASSVGVGLFLMVMIGFQSGQYGSISEMASVYIFIGAAYMLLIMMLLAYKAMLPMSMALGATRRCCFWGIQLTKWVTVLAVPALAGLLCLLFPRSREVVAPLLPFFAAVLLLTASAGAFSGLAFCRWGKLGAFIMVAVIIIGSIAMGAVCGMVFEAGKEPLDLLANDTLPLFFAAVALAVYGLDFLLEWSMMKTYEVKL